jgi:hypothetical protein
MHQFLKFILGMKLYMFRTVSLSINGSFSLYTQQWCMSCRFADSLRAGSRWNCLPSWSCSQAFSKPVWYIPLLCVQWKTSDDGQRSCPKHVEFHSKNKFEKLGHIVGIIRNLTQLYTTCFPSWSGWNCSSILILLASCQQICMTYTIAVCTVKNSWWWTEELSETCRISFQE